MNIHSHYIAFKNDFNGHKIMVMFLSQLDQRAIAVGIALSPAGTQM